MAGGQHVPDQHYLGSRFSGSGIVVASVPCIPSRDGNACFVGPRWPSARCVRGGRFAERPGNESSYVGAGGAKADRGDRKKGASLRICGCGRQRLNRGTAPRQVVSCLGTLRLQRHWWGGRGCCEALGYGADTVLGWEGTYTRTLQEHVSRLTADVSFAKAREHLTALLRVAVSKEALRRESHRLGRGVAKGATKGNPN